MSSPQGNDQGQGQGSDQGQSQGRSTRKPRVLDVVEYTHTDPILGREHTGRGVVLRLDDEAATVVPLAGHAVQVDPANLTPLTAADVADS